MIRSDILKDIEKYCKLNDIEDVNEFINNALQTGFNVEKYGTSPIKPQVIEKEVEKIIEKEVIKEVPVEKIVEIDKVVEVPVTDDKEVKKLLTRIEELETELNNQNPQEIVELKSQIKNLQLELELEKNRNAKPKEKIKSPFDEKPKNNRGNIINWVSEGERKDDLYNED